MEEKQLACSPRFNAVWQEKKKELESFRICRPSV